MATLEDHEKKIALLLDTDKEMRRDYEKNKTEVIDRFKETTDSITAVSEKFDGHESRIIILEEELQLLKDRPVAQVSEGVDYSLICMKADFNDLVARVAGTEKRNLEQDDRLTNNELRIEKLEKMISDPMERIMALEQAVANLNLELNNRPTV